MLQNVRLAKHKKLFYCPKNGDILQNMNNLNDNFLENDLNDQQYVEEIVEEIFEEEQMEESQNEILTEAEKRIEQANLYQALLKHDLFGPGSARPEIIDSVRKEFKGFILSRLEILLGIKPETQKQAQVQVQSPFSDEEISALKAIASRLMKKEPAQVSPTVYSVAQAAALPQKPLINTISAAPLVESSPQPKKIVKKTVVRKKVQQDLSDHVTDAIRYQPEVNPNKQKKRETQNTSAITGQDYSQAIVDDNPALRPKPMPSAAEIDMLNAKQAEMNSRGTSASGDPNTAGIAAKLASNFLKS